MRAVTPAVCDPKKNKKCRAIHRVWGPTKWAGEFAIRSLALETPLSSWSYCTAVYSHGLISSPSSSCAKLILSEALTLSWATMSGWSCWKKKKRLPVQHPSSALFRVSTPLVKSPQPWKKKRNEEEGEGGEGRGKIKTEYACIKFNTFVPMATIQHVIHLSSRIRADGVHCLGPGEHGCLEHARPPLPPSDRHPGHSPRCYFSLIHIRLVFFIANHTTNDHRGKKKKGGKKRRGG